MENIPSSQLARREKLEKLFAAAYLERDLYHRDHELKVYWPENLGLAAEIALRLQTPSGRIYGELQPFFVRPGAVANLGKVYRVPDGAYQVVLMPRLEEYYEQGLKIQRRINLQIANGPFSTAPYGTPEQRLQEALDDAARRNLGLGSELAKLLLERWAQLKPAVIEQAIARVNQRTAGWERDLLGLLGMAARFGADPRLPAQLLLALEAAICQAVYPVEKPTILSAACAIIAGQLYPTQIFTASGEPGAALQTQGEAQALAWLQAQAHGDQPVWSSGDQFATTVLTLTHLVDWAAHNGVAELAAVMLDKLFFTLAVNSHQGVYGWVGHAGRSDATTGLARLLWGMGAWNNEITGTVALAGSSYELPPLLAQIAADQPAAVENREQHGGVNRVAYKTPDYLLCSVQDSQPVAGDAPQPVWQATLGPDAVVLAQPAGRVAQWHEVLLALPSTAASPASADPAIYFPTAAFDEYRLHGGWAFARFGNAYLALRASSELQLITTGECAGRELRPATPTVSYLLHLGRAAQDGNFADFQAKILALAITLAPERLQLTTLRGDTLAFGWDEPLQVNGAAQPSTGFKHYDNPYCVADLGAGQMEIQFGDELMRLDFSLPLTLPEPEPQPA